MRSRASTPDWMADCPSLHGSVDGRVIGGPLQHLVSLARQHSLADDASGVLASYLYIFAEWSYSLLTWEVTRGCVWLIIEDRFDKGEVHLGARPSACLLRTCGHATSERAHRHQRDHANGFSRVGAPCWGSPRISRDTSLGISGERCSTSDGRTPC